MDEQVTSDKTVAEWLLKNARVVGVLKRGGAIAEAAASLTVREGRTHMLPGEDEEDESVERERLHYEFTFEVVSDEGPQCTISQWARIDITGTDDEGRLLSIAGSGWLGYDEAGNPNGGFIKPPKVRVMPYDPGESLKKQVADQWKRSLVNPANLNTKH